MQLAFLVGITTLCITVFVYLWLAGLEKTRKTTILAGQSFVPGTTPISRTSVADADTASWEETATGHLSSPDALSLSASISTSASASGSNGGGQSSSSLSAPETELSSADHLDIPVWQRKRSLDEMSRNSFQLEDTVVLQTPSPAPLDSESYYLLKRRLCITYSRRLPAGKACYISIKIAGDLNDLSAMSRSQHTTLQAAPNNWLQINAQDPTPVLQAELHFVEGEFSCSRKVLRHRLHRHDETEFQFVVKPLKDEDCLVTVELFYMRETASTASQNETQIVAEKVLLANLVITATSFFGLHAGQLELVKRLVSIAGVLLLLFLAIHDGQFVTNCDTSQLNCTTDSSKLLEYFILILANIASIPMLDALNARISTSRY
ncbi:hypothetical protein KDA_62580 [Dictyobacter alpinus]|uniref:Uncharacterized protein n=1 Tax=Dictyobacter alpinus TaxID=2014873 RepID=A0A402BH81_9CHLR|nr:hypothetical protein [Dictyobacter alpinus]GCE30774.1 hypothetical protein KDA_62580 [Dictyobacter alpinus]